jgi:hypothetical protein
MESSMRRAFVIMIATGVLAVAGAGSTGCSGSGPASVPPTGQAPARHGPSGAKQAGIYVPVLRRYLSTPAENSFPPHAFKTVYVLDHSYPHAAIPVDGKRGTPITRNAQHLITAALERTVHVAFVADRDTVIDKSHGCAQVKNGGILITLGTPDSEGTAAKVAVDGFVACLGATHLTYVVKHQADSSWRVTGTTGGMGIS